MAHKIFRDPLNAIGNHEDARTTDPDDTEATLVALAKGQLKAMQDLKTDVADGITIDTTGLATSANQDQQETLTGAVLETAPATDTASSGLNGRLQRIAQRLTSLIALVPASIGTKTAAASLGVTVASDDPLVTRLGEVQASPTSNTVLDRLKALLTGIVLAAGSAIIGKVGIDQTTSGTTNLVATISGQNGVAGGAGAVGATVQRTTLASDDPAVATLGATTGTKVVTDANGTLQQYLRGLVTFFANALGAGTAAAAHRTTLASDDPAVATLGATTGAAVITDANGTVQQYLRGLVKQWIAGTLVVGAGENMIGKTVNILTNPSANFTRPTDTTAYASGDQVANNTSAGSVTPLSWSTAARVVAGNFFVRRARLKKSTVTTTNASFRLHLYGASPTIGGGDNAAWSTSHSTYYGAIDITVDKAFTDAAAGNGAPLVGGEINIALASGQTIYGLLEARAAYSPGNAEVFTVELEIHQN